MVFFLSVYFSFDFMWEYCEKFSFKDMYDMCFCGKHFTVTCYLVNEATLYCQYMLSCTCVTLQKIYFILTLHCHIPWKNKKDEFCMAWASCGWHRLWLEQNRVVASGCVQGHAGLRVKVVLSV